MSPLSAAKNADLSLNSMLDNFLQSDNTSSKLVNQSGQISPRRQDQRSPSPTFKPTSPRITSKDCNNREFLARSLPSTPTQIQSPKRETHNSNPTTRAPTSNGGSSPSNSSPPQLSPRGATPTRAKIVPPLNVSQSHSPTSPLTSPLSSPMNSPQTSPRPKTLPSNTQPIKKTLPPQPMPAKLTPPSSPLNGADFDSIMAEIDRAERAAKTKLKSSGKNKEAVRRASDLGIIIIFYILAF